MHAERASKKNDWQGKRPQGTSPVPRIEIKRRSNLRQGQMIMPEPQNSFYLRMPPLRRHQIPQNPLPRFPAPPLQIPHAHGKQRHLHPHPLSHPRRKSPGSPPRPKKSDQLHRSFSGTRTHNILMKKLLTRVRDKQSPKKVESAA